MTERKNTSNVLGGNTATKSRTRKPAADHTVVNAPEHRGLPTGPRATAAKAQTAATVTTLVDATNVVDLAAAKTASKKAASSKVTGKPATVTDLGKARTAKTAAKKAPAKKAPAKKAAAKKAPAAKPDLSQRAQRAHETRTASAASSDQLTCRVCQLTKAVSKFPTTGRDADGNVKRGSRCRACRDAGLK